LTYVYFSSSLKHHAQALAVNKYLPSDWKYANITSTSIIQDVLYDYHAEIHGTGSQSEVSSKFSF